MWFKELAVNFVVNAGATNLELGSLVQWFPN